MKKFFWLKTILFSLCLLAVSLSPLYAANLSNAFDSNTLKAAAGTAGNSSLDVYQIIGLVIQVLLSLLGIIFMGLILYGGGLWMTAEGDEAKVEKAQSIIRSAAIGLVIAMSAYAISYFVVSALNKAVLN